MLYKLFILYEHDVKNCPNCRRLKSWLTFYKIPQIVLNFCESTLLQCNGKTIFCLNWFTSHRAAKTWGSWKLFYSNLFSATICQQYQMIASDSPQNNSFPFSCRMVASQNPPSDCLRLSQPLTTTQMPHMSASKIIVPLIINVMIHYYGVVMAKYQPEKTTRNINRKLLSSSN